MSAFLGNIIIAITPSISKTSTSTGADRDTDDIEAIAKGGRGNFSYDWNNSGTDATVNNKNSSKTKLTGKSTLGKTTAFCKIYDIVTGNTVITPSVDIDWTAITLTATTISATTTYTGSSQSILVLDGINGTYSGSKSAAGTNVNSYTTTIAGTGAYTGSVTGTLVIGKATLTITTNNLSMTYGSSVPAIGYSLSGLLGTDRESVVTGLNGITHSTTGTSSSNVGSYPTVTNVSGLSASNYNFTAVNGTLTISAATLTATGTTGSATYSGSSQSVTVITGINGTYSGSASASGTNAGSYSTTITGTGNYTGSVGGTLTISAATLTATGTTGSATFNGDSQTVTVISGINGTFSGSASASGTNAGTYTTTIAGTGNYTGSVGGTLTIIPATISFEPADVTIQGTTVPRTYNGTTQSISYVVTGGARNNYSYIISGTSAINVGTYTATITSTTSNYVISPTLNSFTWNITTPLTASTTTGSATYNGSSQTVTVLGGINGTYSGSTSVSGTNAGGYTTTIYGTGNYTGSVTGTLTINRAALSATGTTSPYTTYNRASQSFTISGINGTYSGNPTVSGTNAGTYTTTITGTGNYIGSVTGTLTIYQDIGYIDIFPGGSYDASRTTDINVPVRISNAAFTVTHYVLEGAAADSEHYSRGSSGPYEWNGTYSNTSPGATVRNKNSETTGFVVSITAAINDSNYTYTSATTTVRINAYVAPPTGGTGYGGGGGLIAE
jgi:hypothetical protein